VQLDLIRKISIAADTKIVLVVMDGLGGLPHPDTYRTELEQANTPNLDRMARDAACGLTIPVATGITPGSGPGHLALFGYDPIANDIGRGVLEATGIDFPLTASDIAARGNFCTVDGEGVIVDRRAGRVATEISAPLCARLAALELPGVEVFVEPVREHRFVLVLRGEGLSDRLTSNDPNREGFRPLPVEPLVPEAADTANLVNVWVEEARHVLADEHPANFTLVRGFSKVPDLPQMREVFKLRAASVAVYPMYRGLAKLVGMDALSGGNGLDDQLATVRERWDDYDYFFIHYKKTDAAGEDGDFQRKVHAIEELDAWIPELLELGPDVVMVAGDHSTPAVMAAHSWHPVPFMLCGPGVRADDADEFNERHCQRGSLGTFPATEALPLAMAHSGRFTKYGA
jgi:2,3-bisphosphoglycerate-independent phosphoglycerate mutase